MEPELKITYDPAADAMYIRLREYSDSNAGETVVDEEGVIVDTDETGNPRGFEVLSVRTLGVPLATLPPQVAKAISAFIASGALERDVLVEHEYPA
jgi:uncharacterized protein YuzE